MKESERRVLKLKAKDVKLAAEDFKRKKNETLNKKEFLQLIKENNRITINSVHASTPISTIRDELEEIK